MALDDSDLLAIMKAATLLAEWMSEPGRSQEDQLRGAQSFFDLYAIVDPDAVQAAFRPFAATALEAMSEIAPEEVPAAFARLDPELQGQFLNKMLHRPAE